jgi:hypothetical protein
MKDGKIGAGFYWAWYKDCTPELRDAFGPIPDMPENEFGRGKRVRQLHPVTGELMKLHASMQTVCKDFQASHKHLQLASKNKTVYKNFKWVFAKAV